MFSDGRLYPYQYIPGMGKKKTKQNKTEKETPQIPGLVWYVQK
jgi:hypothetical protein